MTTKLVFFPTYNEAGNVASMLARISWAVPTADILIVDDNSRDGTLDILAGCGKDNVKFLVRPRKLGLATVHLLAWRYALHHGYEILVTMDGDYTHDPAEIPVLLEKLDEGNDLVIGSRYIQGGRCDYAWYRKWLSHTANVTTRRLLQIRLSEFTDSYRVFRVNRLLELDFGSLVVSDSGIIRGITDSKKTRASRWKKLCLFCGETEIAAGMLVTPMQITSE